MSTAAQRRERLKGLYERTRGCEGCQLHRTRTRVVFGSGNADAELMFVGEAPGANEDRQGLPFVGQAGRLLERLLGEIGLSRADVFIANVLMCRPPDNRDPLPREIEACGGYLREKIALIEPVMICTLGNFATKLLREDQTSISRIHGREEVRIIGSRAVRLYPLYHPAAALYHPNTLELLRADFHRIPTLLSLGAPPQPQPAEPLDELQRWQPAPTEPAGSGDRGGDDRAGGHGQALDAPPPGVKSTEAPAADAPVLEQLGLF